MSNIGQNSERGQAIAKAVAELERLLVAMGKPSDFGTVRVSAEIQGGKIVRLIPSWEQSIKLTV